MSLYKNEFNIRMNTLGVLSINNAIVDSNSNNKKKMDADSNFYENDCPQVDDLVMVRVESVSDLCVLVTLLEYSNREAYVAGRDLTRTRVRTLNQVVRVGATEVMKVIRVDTEKGHIDVSKIQVVPDEISQFKEKFSQAKTVHSIMAHLAHTTGFDFKLLCEAIAWPLNRTFGNTYEAFRSISHTSSADQILQDLEFPDESVKQKLIEIIQRRLKKEPTMLRADIEVTCFSHAGIDGIKHALECGEQCGTDDIPVKIMLISAPLYTVTAKCDDKENGLKLLADSIQSIQKCIESHGGNMTVKEAPRVTNDLNSIIQQ
jgi:translation initiation factor 2 subunit 1